MNTTSDDGLMIDHVQVRYGLTTAVDDVSLHVAPGQIVALLGPSGSGKSTLLRAVAGLEPVTAGRMTWNGTDMTPVPVHRRNFGLMFQEGQLFPHRSVAGNVAYGLHGKMRGEDAAQVVTKYLDLVGLTGYGDRHISTLSGGQAQRVALARSLAPQPQLLLLDEPLSALDRSLREHLVAELRDILTTLSTTALYVTHDQDEAFAIADRIAILDSGHLIACDEPEKLWSHPTSPTVATFLGYEPLLSHEDAASVGVAIEPGSVLALAPDAVEICDKSDIVADVVGVRARRGGYDVTVRLPGGHLARAYSPDDIGVTGQVGVCLNVNRTAVVPDVSTP